MCYFITLGIQADRLSVLNTAVPRDLSAWRCENPYILKHMEVGCHGYALTDRHCSCDLYSCPSGQKGSTDPLFKRRRKYERRGWSEAKIQRALDDSSAHGKPVKVGLRDDVRVLIADLVDKAGRIDVFVHFYSGTQKAASAEKQR